VCMPAPNRGGRRWLARRLGVTRCFTAWHDPAQTDHAWAGINAFSGGPLGRPPLWGWPSVCTQPDAAREGGPTPLPDAVAHDIMQIIRIRTAYRSSGGLGRSPGRVRIISRIMFNGCKPGTQFTEE